MSWRILRVSLGGQLLALLLLALAVTQALGYALFSDERSRAISSALGLEAAGRAANMLHSCFWDDAPTELRTRSCVQQIRRLSALKSARACCVPRQRRRGHGFCARSARSSVTGTRSSRRYSCALPASCHCQKGVPANHAPDA